MKFMLLPRSRSASLVILFSVLLVLLLLAGGLLYRWIDRVSIADRQQQQEMLNSAMRSFQGEFSGALQEILSTFRPVPRLQADTGMDDYLAELYSQWQRTANQPQLVGSLSMGIRTPDDNIPFRRFRSEDGQFAEQAWPPALETFRDILKQRPQRGEMRPPIRPEGFALALSENRPVIVLPLMAISTRGRRPPAGVVRQGHRPGLPGGGRGPGMFSRPGQIPVPGSSPTRPGRPSQGSRRMTPPRLAGWCFLELDPEFLQEQFFPALVERHFRGADLAGYRLAVVTGTPRRVLYRSDSALTPASLSSVDARVTLFRPMARLGPEFPLFWMAAGGRAGRRALALDGRNSPDQAVTLADARRADARSGSNVWQLVAKHTLGSLDAAMNVRRRRNLGIGLGMLFLLGSSMALLLLVTQRARGLAKRQMEFVAGVSHELRTPLSIIKSAGFNLAEGLVEDSSHVQHYGTVIRKEARRLSDMVEQMLSYAGIQSGTQRYEFQPVQVSKIIDRALAEYAAAFEEAGWHVEKNIEENMPPVLADAQALESVIKNLLQNALKYAADGKWLRISARVRQSKENPEVQVTVEDRGPGIDPTDVPHIFDPFYRGRSLVASSIPGAGLGLSLLQRHIQAHGGRMTLKTSPGNGAAFTLHLPTASQSESGVTTGRK